MYRVAYDRVRNILTIHVSGFLTPDEVPAFAAEVAARAQTAAAIRGDFDVIVDSLDFPVQANDVADLLSRIMHEGIVLTRGRAAVVVGSQLNKLQAERTLVHPRLQVFRAMDDAHAWLDAPKSVDTTV
ncbi:MAG: hypothetical protein V4537_12375 [Pseudomonadota bacterium]